VRTRRGRRASHPVAAAASYLASARSRHGGHPLATLSRRRPCSRSQRCARGRSAPEPWPCRLPALTAAFISGAAPASHPVEQVASPHSRPGQILRKHTLHRTPRHRTPPPAAPGSCRPTMRRRGSTAAAKRPCPSFPASRRQAYAYAAPPRAAGTRQHYATPSPQRSPLEPAPLLSGAATAHPRLGQLVDGRDRRDILLTHPPEIGRARAGALLVSSSPSPSFSFPLSPSTSALSLSLQSPPHLPQSARRDLACSGRRAPPVSDLPCGFSPLLSLPPPLSLCPLLIFPTEIGRARATWHLLLSSYPPAGTAAECLGRHRQASRRRGCR
jgi:hypothetical protein